MLVGKSYQTFKLLSHVPSIRIRSGSNPDQIWISCVHTDSLIRINMPVKTTFRDGFDWHSIHIKDGSMVVRPGDNEGDALIDFWL